MGWSCRKDASDTMNKWENACFKLTGITNVYVTANGRYYWEYPSVEHRDGAITGKVWRYVDANHVVPAGSYRIDPDGTVKRAPAFLKGV